VTLCQRRTGASSRRTCKSWCIICIMVKIGSSQKRRLSKTVNFYGIRGEMYKFAEVGGKFINFVEIGGNAICIVGLMGMNASGDGHYAWRVYMYTTQMRYIIIWQTTGWFKIFLYIYVCDRACFNVQWCTRHAALNENVQWWKAVFVVMSHEEIRSQTY